MDISSILSNYKKGTFVNITITRPAKVKKSVESAIEKHSEYIGARLGIDYDNLAQTKTLREDGSIPKENAGLVWGEWLNFPYLIQHKGQIYLRVYAEISKIKTTWIENGEEVSKNNIADKLLSSEKNTRVNDNKFATLTIKVSNIQEIKQGKVGE